MARQIRLKALISSAALCAGLSTQAGASAFDINVIFGGGLTVSQQAVFSSAESFWESQVLGYLEDPGISTLNIDASGVAIDGPGGVLGQAGPTFGVTTSNFLYASDGAMEFDTADLSALEAAGSLFDVIQHEMAHVMGFGTLWSSSGVGFPGKQEVYVDGSGEYTGAAALAAYKQEFDPAATFVPVELDGGQGTADAHWDEDWAGGRSELMTGFLDAPTFVSRTTVASFEDIGYAIVPIPLPAGILLGASAFGLLGLLRQRGGRPAA